MRQEITEPDCQRLIAQVLDVAEKTGCRHVPQGEFAKHSKVTNYRIQQAFGSYTGFLAAAGLEACPNAPINDHDLLGDLRDACMAAGGVISRIKFRSLGKYTIRVYSRRWGSWRNVLIALRRWVEEHDPNFPYLAYLRTLDDAGPVAFIDENMQPRYGAPMEFRGIANEPINEHGVILLCGTLAHDLGFSVERVAPKFPDCEAKRRVADGWRRTRIEFEFRSRNFEHPRHDPSRCDLIVCWEHNWPEAPVEVLELKAEVEKRRNAAPRALSSLG
jgi:hypothetical protein